MAELFCSRERGVCTDLALQRMGLNYADLYLIHHPVALKPEGHLSKASMDDPESLSGQGCAADENGHFVPDLEHCPAAVAASNGGQGSILPTWNVMKALVRGGKPRAIGVSNFDIEHVQEILGSQTGSDDETPLSCNQIEAHPWYPNERLVDFQHEHKILTMAYRPFASLNYEIRDGVVTAEPFAPYGVPLLRDETVAIVAKRNNMTPAQVLLSWAVQRSTLPIFRSSSKVRQAENLVLQGLPREDVDDLNSMKLEGVTGQIAPRMLFPYIRDYDCE